MNIYVCILLLKGRLIFVYCYTVRYHLVWEHKLGNLEGFHGIAIRKSVMHCIIGEYVNNYFDL